MQTKLVRNSDTEVQLSINATETDLLPVKKKVLKHLARDIKLPGFREGKAPMNLIEKNIDQNTLQQEFLSHALNDLYGKAVAMEKLRPIAEPEAKLKKFVPFSELEVELTLQVIGEIKLTDYTKIKKVKPVVKITAKEVDEVVESLQKRLADKKAVDRPAKNGDEAMIDFRGVNNKGEPVNGADGKDYPLILGSNTFIPGFEDNLLGMKSGQEKTFTLTFPKDYGVSALANKNVTFTVKILKISELEEPEANDAFAAKAGPFKTLQELKADIKKQLEYEKQREADRQFENELIQEISEKSKVAIPKALVDEQIERGEQEERRNLSYRGQTWQEHLLEEGVSEDEHRERNRQPAEAQVKASLVLSEIAEREKVDVTPEELEIRLQILKGQYQDPQMQQQLNTPEARRDVASRLLTEKTVNKLVKYATGK
jgi:trigger factor